MHTAEGDPAPVQNASLSGPHRRVLLLDTRVLESLCAVEFQDSGGGCAGCCTSGHTSLYGVSRSWGRAWRSREQSMEMSRGLAAERGTDADGAATMTCTLCVSGPRRRAAAWICRRVRVARQRSCGCRHVPAPGGSSRTRSSWAGARAPARAACWRRVRFGLLAWLPSTPRYSASCVAMSTRDRRSGPPMLNSLPRTAVSFGRAAPSDAVRRPRRAAPTCAWAAPRKTCPGRSGRSHRRCPARTRGTGARRSRTWSPCPQPGP